MTALQESSQGAEPQVLSPAPTRLGTLPRPQGLLVALVIAVFFLAQATATWVTTDGSFYYTLDDAYIHLALSEEIRQLRYGVNPAEPSTPSSSVAWPFLLAVTAGTPVHALTPLLLNFAATLATGWLLLRLLVLTVGKGEIAHRQLPSASAAVCLLLLLLNWAGVAFTGMEHSVHIAASLAVGVGLVELRVRGAVRWWLVVGVLIGPALRYEGLAVSLAAGAVLYYLRHRALALATSSLCLLPLLAFSLAARTHGLALLPSSVLAKSLVVGDGADPVLALVISALGAAQHPVFLVLLAVLALDLALRPRSSDAALRLFGLSVLLAHATAGSFGWYHRYELYALAAVLPVLVHRFAALRWSSVEVLCGRRNAVLATALVFLATAPYASVAVTTPFAARNIHLQQAQMARFAADHWRAPVAVNDLGLVSYAGDEYVLDLWGLASEEARVARQSKDGDAWMDRLVDERAVGLAMIYEGPEWFETVPEEWELVATLEFDMPAVSVAEDTVAFYATSGSQVTRVHEALRSFAPTLPAGASLVITAAR